MQNQSTQQAKRANNLEFTGNVSRVKPLQSGFAISLAYNEGKMVNGQWETSDTLFIETFVPSRCGVAPCVGDRMTVRGFIASNNYTPQNGKKRFGVKIVVNEVLEYSPKQNTQQSYQPQQNPQYQQPNNNYQNQPQNQPQSGYNGNGQGNNNGGNQQYNQQQQPQNQPQGGYQGNGANGYQQNYQQGQQQNNFQQAGGFNGR